MKNFSMRLAAVAVLAIYLGGCTTLASFVASTATNLSSGTPEQVTTLGDADLAADAVVHLTTATVDTNKLNAGQLMELQQLRAAVRAALDSLHTASAAGQSLNFAAFNAALDAWRAYKTQQGV
jgi:hypothetical protein